MKLILMQIYIFMMLQIKIETDNYVHLIFQVKAIQNVDIANFQQLRENSNEPHYMGKKQHHHISHQVSNCFQ